MRQTLSGGLHGQPVLGGLSSAAVEGGGDTYELVDLVCEFVYELRHRGPGFVHRLVVNEGVCEIRRACSALGACVETDRSLLSGENEQEAFRAELKAEKAAREEAGNLRAS